MDEELVLRAIIDEWVEVADGLFQNKRDYSIFKQKDEFDFKPYNVDTF